MQTLCLGNAQSNTGPVEIPGSALSIFLCNHISLVAKLGDGLSCDCAESLVCRPHGVCLLPRGVGNGIFIMLMRKFSLPTRFLTVAKKRTVDGTVHYLTQLFGNLLSFFLFTLGPTKKSSEVFHLNLERESASFLRPEV